MSENSSVHRAAAEGFSSGAETYVRGRPDYPTQALDWLRNVLGLGAGKTVVDLGAGTGKFTRVLLATDASVIAVEPVAPMLERLRRDLPESPQSPGGSEPAASSGLATSSGLAASPRLATLAGTAEHIPVASASVDAVVCAQAFHWFATPAALAEIHRVLKPGGALGLIWNQRDESVDWLAALGKLFERYEGDAPRMKSGEWRKVFPAPGFTPLQEVRFPHTHVGPPERVIIDRFMSVSFIAALSAAERQQALTEIRNLIARSSALAGRSEVSVPYVTMAFHCRREN
jgi:ubiquinone/menaquinone biosynthesis C-methylase UbiE